MPPWKPRPGRRPEVQARPVALGRRDRHARRLGRGRAPRGRSRATCRPPPTFADDWALGTPDLSSRSPDDFAIPAAGDDIYRCFVIPTNLPKDVYISAIEYRPGNRRVVHHSSATSTPRGEARKRDAGRPGARATPASPGPASRSTATSAAGPPATSRAGCPTASAGSCRRGADVIMQVHYHPSGKPETDRTRIGLHFARKPVKQTLHWSAAPQSTTCKLPAGRARTSRSRPTGRSRSTSRRCAVDAPHAPARPRHAHVGQVTPTAATQDLIKIHDWDFDWQNTYYFEKPIDAAQGLGRQASSPTTTTRRTTPATRTARPSSSSWGEATTDEMCIGFIAVTRRGRTSPSPARRTTSARSRSDSGKNSARRWRKPGRPRSGSGPRRPRSSPTKQADASTHLEFRSNKGAGSRGETLPGPRPSEAPELGGRKKITGPVGRCPTPSLGSRNAWSLWFNLGG